MSRISVNHLCKTRAVGSRDWYFAWSYNRILSTLFKMNIENLEGIVERIHFIRLGLLVLVIGISYGPIIIFFHPFLK